MVPELQSSLSSARNRSSLSSPSSSSTSSSNHRNHHHSYQQQLIYNYTSACRCFSLKNLKMRSLSGVVIFLASICSRNWEIAVSKSPLESNLSLADIPWVPFGGIFITGCCWEGLDLGSTTISGGGSAHDQTSSNTAIDWTQARLMKHWWPWQATRWADLTCDYLPSYGVTSYEVARLNLWFSSKLRGCKTKWVTDSLPSYEGTKINE